jgi:putative membrane protein
MVGGWEFEPLVVVPLLATALLYAAGVVRLWRRAGLARGVSRRDVGSFAAGWLALAAALVSPLASWSEARFSIHMTQHTLLMLVAAPLLTFGRPLFVWMWALGDRSREPVAHAVRGPRIARAWRAATAPLAVFLLQAAALWIWHLPSWYEAALRYESLHALQHLTFLLSASLFWWAMVHGRYGRMGYGLAVLYVFLTAVHSSVLGALLAVSTQPWYAPYQDLGDQQLAGLIMWIPASVVFIVLGLALCAAWLGEAERRVRLGPTDAASRGAGRAAGGAIVLLVVIAAAGVSACGNSADREAEQLTGGSVARGKTAIGKYGCAACHTIPGIEAATATVGPPLSKIAVRQYLGGHLINTPDNMEQWIQHPQKIDPKNVMPEMGVTEQDARDITAFLYTLR